MTASPIPGLSDAQALAHRRTVRQRSELRAEIDALRRGATPAGERVLRLLLAYDGELADRIDATQRRVRAAMEAARDAEQPEPVPVPAGHVPAPAVTWTDAQRRAVEEVREHIGRMPAVTRDDHEPPEEDGAELVLWTRDDGGADRFGVFGVNPDGTFHYGGNLGFYSYASLRAFVDECRADGADGP